MLHRGFRILVGLVAVALIGAPFFLGNVFFAPAARAAAAINFITYTSGTVTYTSGIPTLPNPVYAREPVTFTANATDAAGLVFVWDFGDGESAIGDASNNGSITHRYDKAFVSTSTIQPTVRLYAAAAGTSPVAERSIAIRVDPLRLPANYSSMTPAEKAGTSDTWPFTHITRIDGPGPYQVGSQVDFLANASVRGYSPSTWKGNDTFQWRVIDASRTEVRAGVVHATVDATGAFNVVPPGQGWYEVSMQANQSNAVASQFVDVYDTASHVFFMTDNPAEVGSAVFSVDVISSVSPLVYPGVSEPFSSVNYRADAAVTGGIGPFMYIWNYPNDVKSDSETNDFITAPSTTYDRTSELNAAFRRSGTKNMYLTVVDGTFRRQTDTIVYSITNTNAPAGTVPFSPTLNITVSPSPILVTLVEANNKALTVQVGTGLAPPAPEVFQFLATAAHSTPPYQIQLSATNRTATPCISAATTLQCEYSFNAYGTFTVIATVLDGSNPSQSKTYQRSVVIQQVGATGGTGGTGTGGTGDTGSTGGTGTGSTGGVSATLTSLDPRASQYGLRSTFSRVGIGQSNDLKGSIATIINIVLGFLGIVAVIFVIFGGMKIMTAAGNEDATASGKQAIIGGVIGLAIVFAAWAIANFVVNNFAGVTA